MGSEAAGGESDTLTRNNERRAATLPNRTQAALDEEREQIGGLRVRVLRRTRVGLGFRFLGSLFGFWGRLFEFGAELFGFCDGSGFCGR